MWSLESGGECKCGRRVSIVCNVVCRSAMSEENGKCVVGLGRVVWIDRTFGDVLCIVQYIHTVHA